MNAFFHFIEISVLCFAGLIVLAILFLFIVLRMPHHRLKQLLKSLMWRLAASVGVGLVAIPIQAFPEIDVAYNFGSMIVLALYWFGFFEEYYRFRKMR